MSIVKFSIITICFNSEKTISQTLESVLEQSYSPFEYIIIDGKSTDNTVKIIKSFEQRFSDNNIKFTLVSEPDKGIYDAINKGIDLVTGDVVGIVHSNDWYDQKALEYIEQVFSSSDTDIAYGILRYIENEAELRIERTNHEFLSKAMIPHPTCFVRKQVYDDFGIYDTSYKSAADYDLFIKFFINGLKFRPINYVIANFRVGGKSSQFDSRIETLEIQNKYGFVNKKSYRKKRKILIRRNGWSKIKNLLKHIYS